MITPNPKTSGGARWNYLAAWGFALERALGGDLGRLVDCAAEQSTQAQAEAEDFVGEHVSQRARAGHRCASGHEHVRAARHRRRFARVGERGACWRCRRWAQTRSTSSCRPSASLAEPPVALVDARRRSQGHARRCAKPISSICTAPEGQDIVARNYFRPRDTSDPGTYAERFPQIRMFTIDDAFGGWREAQTRHFNDGGIYDRIFVAESAAPPARRWRAALLDRGDCGADGSYGNGERLGKSQRSARLRPNARLRGRVSRRHRADSDGRVDHRAASLPLDEFWRIATEPRALASYQAHVRRVAARGEPERRVRLHHRVDARPLPLSRARRLVDAIIDLPFALPTAVSGIALATVFAPVGLDRRAGSSRSASRSRTRGAASWSR